MTAPESPRPIAILGITGSIGEAVARAFLADGFPIRALVRDPARVASDLVAHPDVTLVTGDASDAASLDRTLAGCEAVLNGVNLPYPDWDPGMIDLTDAIVAAAERAGTRILFPGNVYGLGPDYTHALTEDDPHEPITARGKLRNRMEARIAAATVPSLVVRAGDFFGGPGGENHWFWHLTKDAVAGGKLQYPTDRSTLHGWAYLPDLAETFVALHRRADQLDDHAVFHFAGHVVDGNTFIDAVRAALGDQRAIKAFPWFWMQPLRLFVPMIRELFKMRYLWDQPVRMDGSRLEAFLGDALPHTPYAESVRETIEAMRSQAAEAA
jgi:nucleoside-diphosphate-sugar epimerase